MARRFPPPGHVTSDAGMEQERLSPRLTHP